ncbi:glycosyltransferase family 2 protein [Patescibacteria group bacterium]|nr:glycosyltransferase family 2 protein [Patescibacteria group bacterium]
MIKCSACILTFNNEKTLEKCLESVRDFSDIVILDGGSTDRTLEIARRYSARIYPQQEGGSSKKITDFTAMREKLFSLAGEEWCLWLDSDEWLDSNAIEDIKKIVESKNKDILYSFMRKAVIGNKIIEYAYTYPEYCKRLFNRGSGARLKKGKKVHEDLVVSEGGTVKKLDSIIYHFWDKGYFQLIKKDNHYLELTVKGKDDFTHRKRLRVAWINLLKGSKVLIKSLFIYLRYGFKKTLPISYSWRFARYHFIYAKKIVCQR